MTLAAVVLAATLTLRWQDQSTAATGVSVERAPDPNGSFAEVIRLPGQPVKWTDDALPRHTTFCYRVRAVTATNDSLTSATICKRTK